MRDSRARPIALSRYYSSAIVQRQLLARLSSKPAKVWLASEIRGSGPRPAGAQPLKLDRELRGAWDEPRTRGGRGLGADASAAFATSEAKRSAGEERAKSYPRTTHRSLPASPVAACRENKRMRERARPRPLYFPHNLKGPAFPISQFPDISVIR
jgi:hypothetical protein